MFGIAIDLGYRYTKGMNEEGKKFLALSLVGSASQRNLSNIFGYDGKDDLHVKIEKEDTTETIEAFVGDLARRESRTVTAAFDTNKIYHPNTEVLLATAAGKLMPKTGDSKIHLISGLPVDDFFKQKDEFKKYLEYFNAKVTYYSDGEITETKRINFDKVTLFPQAAGAVYHALAFHRSFFKRGYLIGLVDIGMRTTDVVVFEVADKFQLRQQYCKTLEIGISIFYHEIISHVNELLGSNFDTSKIDLIMQNTDAFYFRGKEYDLRNIIKEAREKVTRVIKDKLTIVWGTDLDAFRVVFLAGGGGIEMFQSFKDFHHTTVLLDDSQFANTHGFMRVHKISVGKPDQKVVNLR